MEFWLNSDDFSSLGWCTLTCKRIKKDQSIGQSIQYTLLSAFEEKFFTDINIKGCDGFSVAYVIIQFVRVIV